MSSTVLTTSSVKLSTTTPLLSSSSSSGIRVSPSLGSSGQPLFSAPCLKFPTNGSTLFTRSTTFRCNSISPCDPGENGSKIILDAFFLGKALAEVANERVESTIGEILSKVGKIQSDQQKYVHEFQEEVIERAKRAQEKAAQEALATPGGTPTAPSPADPTTPLDPNGPSTSAGTDPLVGMLTED